MTNTLHRQGNREDLKHDYVIFVHTAKGKNREGAAPEDPGIHADLPEIPSREHG